MNHPLGCVSILSASCCYPSAATAAKSPLLLLSQAGRRWKDRGQRAAAQTKPSPRRQGRGGSTISPQGSTVERTVSGSPHCNCSKLPIRPGHISTSTYQHPHQDVTRPTVPASHTRRKGSFSAVSPAVAAASTERCYLLSKMHALLFAQKHVTNLIHSIVIFL